MEKINDRELAELLGYPAFAGGYKAAREFMERRGVLPLDDRRPAQYNLKVVNQAIQDHPRAQGNFTCGADRVEQTRKASATKAARRDAGRQAQDD